MADSLDQASLGVLTEIARKLDQEAARRDAEEKAAEAEEMDPMKGSRESLEPVTSRIIQEAREGKRLRLARAVLFIGSACAITLGSLVIDAGLRSKHPKHDPDNTDEEVVRDPYKVLEVAGGAIVALNLAGMMGSMCLSRGTRASRALIVYYAAALVELVFVTWGSIFSLLWKGLATEQVEGFVDRNFKQIEGMIERIPGHPSDRVGLVEYADDHIKQGGIILAVLAAMLAIKLWSIGQLMGRSFTSRSMLYATSFAGAVVSLVLLGLALAVAWKADDGTSASVLLVAVAAASGMVSGVGIFALRSQSLVPMVFHSLLTALVGVLAVGGAGLAFYFPDERSNLLDRAWPGPDGFPKHEAVEAAKRNMHAVGLLATLVCFLLVLTFSASVRAARDMATRKPSAKGGDDANTITLTISRAGH